MEVEGADDIAKTASASVTELSPELQEFGELIQFMETSLQETKKWLTRTKNLKKAHLQLVRRSRKNRRGGELLRTTGGGAGGEPTANRANSGFNKPVRVSAELARVLNLTEHEPIPRVEVTKRLTQYFRDHDLQNPSNRREILLNGPKGEALRPLFPDLDPAKEPLSFFNLQRHLKRHFSPALVAGDAGGGSAVAAASAAVAVTPAVPSSSTTTAAAASSPSVKVVKRVVVKK